MTTIRATRTGGLGRLIVAAVLAAVVLPAALPIADAAGGLLCASKGYTQIRSFTNNDHQHSEAPPPLVLQTNGGKLCHEFEGGDGTHNAYSHWVKP
ncbi:MAG: hypothetical protein HYT80_07885 [Euryarchaeota archaeon]|nr:hypothetical protein [Euryarchaeota archaeon]